MVTSIDTHTVGQPTRTIIGGVPHIPGATMADKMLYLRDNRDSFRTMLMYEPRGHNIMSGAIITQPCDPAADVGVIYIEVGGYLPMCGHDTIGCCTAMVEAGIVPVTEPETVIKLDTPAGLVVARVEVEDNVAKSVTFRNVPSFVMVPGARIEAPGFGEVVFDISWGGNPYALVEASRLGLSIEPGNAAEIIRAGKMLRHEINRNIKITHPEKPFVDNVTHVEFSGPAKSPGAHLQNAVVFPPGDIDRSPCGTGTSAKVAAMYLKGELEMGQEFVHESILGTMFRARVIAETTVGPYRAVIPEITGSAYVTGIHQFVVDPGDPLKDGFLLGL